MIEYIKATNNDKLLNIAEIYNAQNPGEEIPKIEKLSLTTKINDIEEHYEGLIYNESLDIALGIAGYDLNILDFNSAPFVILRNKKTKKLASDFACHLLKDGKSFLVIDFNNFDIQISN